jgi:hypothetical protein
MLGGRRTFQSEKLIVDYISFNLRDGKNNLEKLSQFFHRYYQFNCYQLMHENGKKKPYLVDPSYKFEVVFRFNVNPVNKKTIAIQFSSRNAYYFYRILKFKKFNWQIFDLKNLSLARFDICYIRSNQKIKKDELLSFYERSAKKFQDRYTSSIPLTIETSLALGTRTGDFYLRIYQVTNTSLKFELEVKKYRSKKMTTFLTSNSFNKFEHYMTESFLRYLKIALVFDTCFTDWLLYKLRLTKKPTNHLISHYLNKSLVTNSIKDKANFYQILQFLSFTKTLNFKKQFLNGEIYYNYTFPLTDFAKRIGQYPLDNFKRQKLIKFFLELQKLPPVYKWFSEDKFQSSLAFPVLRVRNKKLKHTKIMVDISVSKTFYQSEYPFYFPKNFNVFESTSQLRLQFSIIEAFSNEITTKKTLNLENLLNKLNNYNKRLMKDQLIQEFECLEKAGFIQKKYHLLKYDEEIITTDVLERDLINSVKLITFFEKI